MRSDRKEALDRASESLALGSHPRLHCGNTVTLMKKQISVRGA